VEIKSIEKIEETFRVSLQLSKDEHAVNVLITRKFDPELSCSVVYEDPTTPIVDMVGIGEEGPVEAEIEQFVLNAIEKSEDDAR